MNLDNLQAFLSVAEHASFSRAADNLFLTQPAVSKRVAALEESLDTPLFDRIGHRISLTEAGLALLPRARRILAEVEDSRRAVTNLAGTVSGALSVGTSHHIGLHRLPPVLRGFSSAYPAVDLDLRFMDSEAACNAVEHGELQLGIVTLPLEPSDNLAIVPVWHDPLTVVVGREHALTKARSVSPAQLAAYPAVLPAKGTYTREVMARAFAPLDVALKVTLSTNYLETIKMLVTVGLGWSVLPLTMVDEQLRALKVPGLRLERTLGIVHHRNRTLSNAATALIDITRGLGDGKS